MIALSDVLLLESEVLEILESIPCRDITGPRDGLCSLGLRLAVTSYPVFALVGPELGGSGPPPVLEPGSCSFLVVPGLAFPVFCAVRDCDAGGGTLRIDRRGFGRVAGLEGFSFCSGRSGKDQAMFLGGWAY